MDSVPWAAGRIDATGSGGGGHGAVLRGLVGWMATERGDDRWCELMIGEVPGEEDGGASVV